MGVTLSYGEIERARPPSARSCATGLGLAPGERVALMLPNLLQYPVALIGALRAGLAVVNVNPLYTASELQLPARRLGRRGGGRARELRAHRWSTRSPARACATSSPRRWATSSRRRSAGW
jgi:hypothetical protein